MAQNWRFRHSIGKVPEITIYFWLVKVLATTVGETFADFLSDTLGLGPSRTTTAVTGAALLVEMPSSGCRVTSRRSTGWSWC